MKILFLITVLFLIFVILNQTTLLKSNTLEKFANNEIFLIKNMGNNLCLYSENEKDIFNKNQDLFIGNCNTVDKKYHWTKNHPNRIKNLISRKCLCARDNYTNQYYCDASIDNMNWNISKHKNGYKISNNGLCLSSECGLKQGVNSCFLQKCEKQNKNQYWNFINPSQKNYVTLVDNNNKCLTVNNGNASDGIKPSLSECNEYDINQEWLFDNYKLKNRSSTTCLGEGKMYSCNNNNVKWDWSIDYLKNNNSKCLTSNNNKIKLQDCDFTNKNQSWIEKAKFLDNNNKTSELTTSFSDLYSW